MSGVSRVRWAAIGAALAVSLGAGGIGIVNATISSGSKAVYVPINPCRLADTRPGGDNVGTKNTPIGANQTHMFTVRGSNGNCTIPVGATAIVANVTAVAPTAQSFMAIWPADKSQPNASSLNYSAGQAPFPNAVTVTLSADGKIKAFNKNGNVHVIVDIAGYYEDHDHDDRYDTTEEIDAKIAETAWPQDGDACTAGALSGTIVNGHDADGNLTVKCFRNLVATLAGSTFGFAEGAGAAAQFRNPHGVAVDAAGNVYVADLDNHRIRKIAAAGGVTTLAGSGAAGDSEGVGATAQFNLPAGVAVDAAGNVYVTELGNNRIRKITPAGAVTTLAGSGSFGSADGVGAAAQFGSPSGVAVDAVGNVYVADTSNHRIRKITPAGAVTTLAGSTDGFADGVGAAAQFSAPYGVAVDAAGNVYVGDLFNQRIRKITPAGAVATLAGSTIGFADGVGTAAQFNGPAGVAVDAVGNVYVADLFNQRIRKITATGAVITLAGSGTVGSADGVGAAAQYNNPHGVAVDAAGNVYVADLNNQRIRKIN
jgi:sugar lactone lactonase YvrE